MKPRLLYSDVHFHPFDAFSCIVNGINSRLANTLAELGRAYDVLYAAGGDTAVCAGDLFHIRGSVATSVLVPVQDFFKKQMERGIKTLCIAGNHDLETNEATWEGSLVSALESVGVKSRDDVGEYVEGDHGVILVPWHSTVVLLKDELTKLAEMYDGRKERTDLIIHAPVDGVIRGIPDHGLTAEWLAKLGFNRVFAGHYHNHVDFGNGVYSIGATSHQTWGDVGTKAGFMMLTDTDVTWYATQAPRFVDLDKAEIDSEEDLINLVDGNYVRISVENPTQEMMNEHRKELREKGAKGVIVAAINTSGAKPGTRETKAKLNSIDQSVIDYADKKGGERLASACKAVLDTVRSRAA